MSVTQNYTISTKNFEIILLALETRRTYYRERVRANADLFNQSPRTEYAISRQFWSEKVSRVDAAIRELVEQVA